MKLAYAEIIVSVGSSEPDVRRLRTALNEDPLAPDDERIFVPLNEVGACLLKAAEGFGRRGLRGLRTPRILQPSLLAEAGDEWRALGTESLASVVGPEKVQIRDAYDQQEC